MAVESERRVAGEVLFRNGHIALDWLKRDSMVGRRCGSKDCGVEFGGGKGAERGRDEELQGRPGGK